VVLVQTAQASAILERAETSFQQSTASANNQNFTTRSGNYGLTTNNSCRPGASLLGRNLFTVFGNGQRGDWHEPPPLLSITRQIRRSDMPNVMECSPMPIFALELDRDGHLSKKTMKLAREEQLTNTLLQGFYPGIRVATVDVPTEPLDACEQAIV
jgi:hypothetical protein